MKKERKHYSTYCFQEWSILLLTVVFAFNSCNDDKIQITDNLQEAKNVHLTTEEVKALKISKKGALKTKEEASQIATLFLNNGATSKSIQTENFECQTLWFYYTPKLHLTKSTDIKTDSIPVYLLCKTNGASILVSGDERLPEVLAYSDKKLSINKTGTAYDIFTERLPLFINETIDEFTIQYDSLLNNAHKKINIENNTSLISKSTIPIPLSRIETEVKPWENIYSYAPLVNVTWGQGSPYNKNINNIYCSSSQKEIVPPVGCTAVATAQVISFHKYPSNTNGYIFNWIEMTKRPNAYQLSTTYIEQIANLMKWVAYGINTSFGCDGSSSDFSQVNSFLGQNGYISDGIFDYNKDKVINSIANSRPVLARGDSDLGGHAWVIDGANKRSQIIVDYFYEYRGKNPKPSEPIIPSEWRLKSSNTRTDIEEFVHCNYGYESNYDGYYIHGIFKLKDESYGTTIYGPDFNTLLMIIPNIRRK